MPIPTIHHLHAAPRAPVALALIVMKVLNSAQCIQATKLVPSVAAGAGDGYYYSAYDEGVFVPGALMAHEDGGILIDAKVRRSVAQARSLPQHENVCPMTIRTDFQPRFGHEQNGTRVEIQQDEEHQFSATFVECESTKRAGCFGIDAVLYTSECMTLYEYRSAGIRLIGSTAPFEHGYIKVPIACQCRLRRKKFSGFKMTDA